MPEHAVRTRFAPSPTGYLHIGGARTALYNLLYARHQGGTFILRVEDTDRTRSTDEAIEQIVESMTWLGLDWDQGPLRQSDRLPVYREAAQRLLSSDSAYYSDDERGRAVRFKIPQPHRELIVVDELRGDVRFDTSLIEDFVILKSDCYPTYNFACVVDDVDMAITHVIRGDDHLSNTPKQVLLYEALGAEPPRFAHIPMITGTDGARLSKRHGATSVLAYREMGILPDALVNFLALLGWSPGEDLEIMSLAEMVDKFDLARVRKVSSQFDVEKLEWMNGLYLREAPAERIQQMLCGCLERSGHDPRAFPPEWLAQVVELYRPRARRVMDVVSEGSFFFDETITYEEAAVEKILHKPRSRELLRAALAALSRIDSWNTETLETAMRHAAEEEGVSFTKVAQAVRVAVTGRTASPGIFETLELLGKFKATNRLEHAVSMLEQKHSHE